LCTDGARIAIVSAVRIVSRSGKFALIIGTSAHI
jgi:hypothetical protein